ncbi:MAG: hypothetical protein OCD76_07230 [Reichenbachiella sp.]
MRKRVVRVPTTDRWGPTHEDGTVELTLMKLRGQKPVMYRVCVWGEDDLGLEKDFTTPNPEEAIKLFDKIQKLKNVTISGVESLGLRRF